MRTQRLRREDGFVLVTATLLLLIMMMIALAVVAFTDTQQNQSRIERVREASFQLGEAAMQSQIFQMGAKWPGAPAVAYPASCRPGAPATDPCPDAASLATAYAGVDYGGSSCSPGTPTVPWQTLVRDNGDLHRTTTDVHYYDAALVNTRPTYDANGDGKLWVRSSSVAKCQPQSAVALVTRNLTPLPFPRNAVTANYFQTNNKGNKTIVDTRGTAAEPADVSLRCAGYSNSGTPPNPCANYQSAKGQVTPERLVYDAMTSPSVASAQMDSFRQQAQAAGRYFPAGVCPDLTGVEGGIAFAEETPAGCSPPGGFTAANPGVLVIARGTIAFGGNSVFYGIIYAANLSNLTGIVVQIQGTALIQGAVSVDGPGGVLAGASKANIVYDDRAFVHIKGYAGAGVVQNSWRLLPRGK